ncbi:MAG: hypothetical protein KGI89_14135, partial [Euryarchaeota archaeon]|nr:hypothetical protein [Euryarchaeota archaeon]
MMPPPPSAPAAPPGPPGIPPPSPIAFPPPPSSPPTGTPPPSTFSPPSDLGGVAAPTFAPPAPPVGGPSKSLFLYVERQALYETLTWRPAGGGVRFSRDIPLRILPPGEPIAVEFFAQNQGAAPLSVTYYVVLTNVNLQGTRLQADSLDIPVGSVLDVTHTLAAKLQPGEYSITVFCVPRAGAGRTQDPASFPALAPVDGTIPPGLPSLYDVIKVREEVPCPSCGGRLLWTPASMGGRPRAWVCGRCAHRVETGIL